MRYKSNAMQHIQLPNDPPAITSLNTFGRQIGRTNPTMWRWRQIGWLDGIVNIAGKPYITAEGIKKFVARAAAGEFSKPPHAPRRTSGASKQSRAVEVAS